MLELTGVYRDNKKGHWHAVWSGRLSNGSKVCKHVRVECALMSTKDEALEAARFFPTEW